MCFFNDLPQVFAKGAYTAQDFIVAFRMLSTVHRDRLQEVVINYMATWRDSCFQEQTGLTLRIFFETSERCLRMYVHMQRVTAPFFAPGGLTLHGNYKYEPHVSCSNLQFKFEDYAFLKRVAFAADSIVINMVEPETMKSAWEQDPSKEILLYRKKSWLSMNNDAFYK